MVHELINSPIVKNKLFLYAKFFYDRLFRPHNFIFQGKFITPVTNRVALGDKKKKILCPTIYHLDRALGWHISMAKALEVRGHEITFMPLDIRFPRRNTLYYDVYDGEYTNSYFNLFNKTLFKSFRIPFVGYSKYGDAKSFNTRRLKVASLSYEACKTFVYKDAPIGDMAYNSVMHYYRRGRNAFSEEEVEGYRDFLVIGMILFDILDDALNELAPDIILTLNGSFLDSRIQLYLAKQKNIRVVSFETGFMLNSVVLNENEPTITYPMSEQFPDTYASYTLTPDQDKTLQTYLSERSLGKNCVLDYFGKPKFNHDAIREEAGIPAGVRPDVLFTNLQWDSTQLHCNIAFPNQLEWIFDTIRFYEAHSERTLAIRIHPAEVNPSSIASKERIKDVIHKKFKKLPSNVIIIPSESSISSYPLTDLSNMVLVYASTTGLEAAIMKKNVLVAGRSHYRGQKFTHDITSIDEYAKLLQTQEPVRPLEEVESLAKKYAYFFFFGYMIPFSLVKEKTTKEKGELTAFNFSSEDELLPGKNADLDFVVRVILGEDSYTNRFRHMIQHEE